MESVFLKILNMSLTASYVIFVVLLARLFFRKAPKKYSYYLWAAVSFRLACPISLPSVWSLFNLNTFQVYPGRIHLNLREVPVYDVTNTILPKPATGISVVNEIMEESSLFQQSYTSVNPIQILLFIGMILWWIGMGILFVYGVVSYWKIKRQMNTAVLLPDNVYESDRIRSPFILGITRPKIYLPFGLDGEIRDYVIAHEQYHIQRKDHIVKVFAFFLLVVHWFNPLVWLSFHLMSKDMEMSCDEKVLSGNAGKKVYSSTLLSFAMNRKFPAASPLAFGESGVKARIKNILNWKQPKRWIAPTALILCVAVIAACGLNPYQNEDLTIGGLTGPLSARIYYQDESDEGSQYVKAMAANQNMNYSDAWEEHQQLRAELVNEKQDVRYQTFDEVFLREKVGNEEVEVDIRVAVAYLYDMEKASVIRPIDAYVLETELVAEDEISFSHGGYTTRIEGLEIRISATGQVNKKGQESMDAKTWNVKVYLN